MELLTASESDLLFFYYTYPKFVKSVSLKLFYDTVVFYSSIYYTETITLEYQNTKRIISFKDINNVFATYTPG